MRKKAIYIKAALIYLATAWFAHEAFALNYKIVTPLKAEDKTALLNVLVTAEGLLPAKVKKALGTVNVEVAKAQGSKEGYKAGHAMRFTNTISINGIFIEDFKRGRSNSRKNLVETRQHKTMYDEGLASIIHETMHLYDLANLVDAQTASLLKQCRDNTARGDKVPPKKMPDWCEFYQNTSTTVSTQIDYLRAAGWMNPKIEENGYNGRSPDEYELRNPKEHFAVNVEHFLMDRDYKCRRPTLYKVLSKYLEHTPYADNNCKPDLSYIVPDGAETAASVVKIDLDRVYEVHYLLADKGQEVMSKWGHAMIRLVICAKERKQVGPDCRKDVHESVVLSYRAFIDTLNISSLDGLTGKYPSRLFIIPMSKVIDEYAKGELRALKSIPLKLNRQQIEDFVTRSVEMHWAYDGKYYFVSNNCATETLHLLQSSLFLPQLKHMTTRTPVDLADSLARAGIADTSGFADLKKAIIAGLYFDSFYDRYMAGFDEIKYSANIPLESYEEYLKLPALSRRSYFYRLKPEYITYPSKVGYVLLLEAGAQRLTLKATTQKIQDLALKRLQEHEEKVAQGIKSVDSDEAKKTEVIKKYAGTLKAFSKPAVFLSQAQGYGLPVNDEINAAHDFVKIESENAFKSAKEAEAEMTSMMLERDLREIKLMIENSKSIFPQAARQALIRLKNGELLDDPSLSKEENRKIRKKLNSFFSGGR